LKELESTYQIALGAAVEAAKKIMAIYGTPFEKETKSDGSPVTQADLDSSRIIHSHLIKTNIPVIGEELDKAAYSERKDWKKCWLVDPLDGTKEFIKKNGEFVINIALIENQQPIFGLIASPVNERILFGGKAINAVYSIHFNEVHNSKSWNKMPHLGIHNFPPIIISSRSHFSGDIIKVIRLLEEEYGGYANKTMGSAMKFFNLCEGKADVYPRLAPTMEWDIAAGQALFEFLGGEIIDFNTKKPLHYNKSDLYNPYFIAYTPRLKKYFYNS
jgi:3'(2'), 5'-bisphosphate nucleotidase